MFCKFISTNLHFLLDSAARPCYNSTIGQDGEKYSGSAGTESGEEVEAPYSARRERTLRSRELNPSGSRRAVLLTLQG